MANTIINFGLKFYFVIGTVFGINLFHVSKKGWRWVNGIQSVYFYVLLVVEIGLLPIFVANLSINYGKDAQSSLSSVAVNKVLTTVIGLLSHFLWITMFTYITIYTRFYIKVLVNLISKVIVFSKMITKKFHENYYIFFICLALNILYFIIPLLRINDRLETNDEIYYIQQFYNFYGNIFHVVFCNLFLCIVEQLLSVVRKLEDEINCWKQRKIILSHSLKLIVICNSIFKNTNESNFKNKIFAFLIIAEEIFSHFRVAISLIFLNSLVYTIQEVTRVTTASDYQVKNIFSIGVNAFHICVISYLVDALHHKTVTLSNFLHKMAAGEDSLDKRSNIYAICDILERFPKINFFGFFTIGRHCLLPILSSFITYLIVGFQFSLSNTENDCQSYRSHS